MKTTYDYVTPLYGLPPIGIGTPEVESISSYIARLAIAHNVRMIDLYNDMIVPVLKSLAEAAGTPVAQYKHRGNTIRNASKILGGINSVTRRTLDALSQLTGITRLDFLTLGPLREVASNQRLLRDGHAWCPACYAAQQAVQNSTYDLLLWSVQEVSVCPKHQQPLASCCPHCLKTFTRLSSTYVPGYCPKCWGFLGAEAVATSSIDEYALYAARATEALLVAASQTPLRQDALLKGLQRCVALYGGGNQCHFAQRVDTSERRVNLTARGQKIPELRFLLQVGYRAGLDLALLLTTGEVGTIHETRFTGPTARLRQIRRNLNHETIEQQLRALETVQPPLSLTDVCKAVRIDMRTLSSRFPDLRRAFKVRYQQYREEQEAAHKAAIRFGLLECLAAAQAFPLGKIACHLGYHYAYLYQHFPKECKQIVNHNRLYQAAQREARLLTLCNEVRRITFAFHKQGVYPSETKVFKVLGQPKEGLIPCVLNAWREAKAELGY